MDLLQSLIVPPALTIGTPSAVNEGKLQSFTTFQHLDQGTSSTSSATTIEQPALADTQETGSARTRRRQRNKQIHQQRKRYQQQQKQQPQTNIKRTKTPALPVPTKPAVVQKAKKRNKYQFYHPDKPKPNAAGRKRVSYEDVYDDATYKQETPSTPETDPQTPSRSNLKASQTCFFWYHGSCKRGHDKRGCNLKHALAVPPNMVVAPPGFVHPGTCELEWCAGDGTKKGRKTSGDGEKPTRYFDVAVGDDGSSDESESGTEEEESECFLKGFEEIGA